ncbi:M48 family metalloprotease [Luteimonas vadosa]|uniref:Putative beta-barrel assembly-enhancing protease n=1 Tax=Luteimonas vadosa TaxID=1165507 RepID=A0ABP9DWR3_9GAMM
MRPTLHLLLPVAAITLALASLHAPAQDSRLPDIGSSAGGVLGPAQQREYGRMMLAQLRHYGYVLEDPLVDGWLRSLGSRLASASDDPEQSFTFFMLNDREVNAFATVGGYIGTNAGLVLTAQSEDEVAAVLAHEIAHVTQEHVLRSVERAQKDSVPILLAMLGAIALASQSDSRSGDNAAMAAVAGAQGLMVQRQIDYTRSNESEADRIGIRTLDRGGYDPDAMAAMFERMQALLRTNQGGARERAPDYLKTHPVTATRISEAKQRAEKLAEGKVRVTTATTTPEGGRIENVQRIDRSLLGAPGSPWSSENPLLPSSLRLPGDALAQGGSGHFGWARERLRVLSAITPDAAIREYERTRSGSGEFSDAQAYGLALARLLDGQGAAAAAELKPLLARHPGDVWVSLALAQAEARAGQLAAADARFEALVDRMPGNRAVTLTYAGVLGERNTAEAGRRAQAILRPLAASSGDDPVFQRTFARASEIAGDTARAGEAWAEAAYLSGRPEQALVQLNTLRKRDDLDYYARARIDARIAAITPTVLELKRQGIRDEDLHRR